MREAVEVESCSIWAPDPAERGPRVQPPEWPANAVYPTPIIPFRTSLKTTRGATLDRPRPAGLTEGQPVRVHASFCGALRSRKRKMRHGTGVTIASAPRPPRRAGRVKRAGLPKRSEMLRQTVRDLFAYRALIAMLAAEDHRRTLQAGVFRRGMVDTQADQLVLIFMLVRSFVGIDSGIFRILCSPIARYCLGSSSRNRPRTA